MRHGYDGSCVHCLFDPRPNPLQKLGEPISSQPFDPDSNRRRRSHLANGNEGVKVRVERHADAPVASGIPQNLVIGRRRQAYLGRMRDIPTASGKQLRRRAWQSLVEKKPPQTGSKGMTSSARVLAAKARD